MHTLFKLAEGLCLIGLGGVLALALLQAAAS